ncbi:MAG: tRNA 2-selenouridine(34) synthase MnmH [Trueperaceae bacterium]
MTKLPGNKITAADVYRPGAGSPSFVVIDVRAPVEVGRGALPGSVNIPILENDERHRVGIAFKESGQEAAVALGYRLTAKALSSRVAAWREVASGQPAAVSCWRGGMRSSLAQEFLAEPTVPVVSGGYKALRAHLVSGLESSLQRRRSLVLSGMTGTGKTDLLESLAGSPKLLALDLEGLARHRGSAFGARGEQPAQQTFENELAARVLLSPSPTLLLEDESRRVGSVELPEPLFRRIARGPQLVLETTWRERVERIHCQYIVEPAERLGPERALAELTGATHRLRRRLGSELVDRLVAVLDGTMSGGQWRESQALEPFIGPLLNEYYDPLYRRAVEKMQRPVLARGTREELAAWIAREP